ncbi:Alpha/Beta hydrolase protein [Aspergillus carlsbadensis]|nr:Alpha/Beta hydrolase protein [Aspergillus carlsbadensis]
MALQSHTLPLDPNGASLYYEIQGAGPVLILVPGGQGTSILFTSLAATLSTHFRVVTYDRRGFHRSASLAVPPTGQAVTAHTNDLAALITHVSHGEGAIVFGSSWAAILAMNLVSTHPDLVTKAILHEATLIALFPPTKATQLCAAVAQILQTYHTKGTAAANRLMMPLLGSQADREAFSKTGAYRDLAALKTDFFALYFQREFVEWGWFVPDVEGLRRERGKLVLVVGEDPGAPRFPGESMGELARRVGVGIGRVPGGHMGYVYREREFASAVVGAVLRDERARL